MEDNLSTIPEVVDQLPTQDEKPVAAPPMVVKSDTSQPATKNADGHFISVIQANSFDLSEVEQQILQTTGVEEYQPNVDSSQEQVYQEAVSPQPEDMLPYEEAPISTIPEDFEYEQDPSTIDTFGIINDLYSNVDSTVSQAFRGTEAGSVIGEAVRSKNLNEQFANYMVMRGFIGKEEAKWVKELPSNELVIKFKSLREDPAFRKAFSEYLVENTRNELYGTKGNLEQTKDIVLEWLEHTAFGKLFGVKNRDRTLKLEDQPLDLLLGKRRKAGQAKDFMNDADIAMRTSQIAQTAGNIGGVITEGLALSIFLGFLGTQAALTTNVTRFNTLYKAIMAANATPITRALTVAGAEGALGLAQRRFGDLTISGAATEFLYNKYTKNGTVNTNDAVAQLLHNTKGSHGELLDSIVTVIESSTLGGVGSLVGDSFTPAAKLKQVAEAAGISPDTSMNNAVLQLKASEAIVADIVDKTSREARRMVGKSIDYTNQLTLKALRTPTRYTEDDIQLFNAQADAETIRDVNRLYYETNRIAGEIANGDISNAGKYAENIHKIDYIFSKVQRGKSAISNLDEISMTGASTPLKLVSAGNENTVAITKKNGTHYATSYNPDGTEAQSIPIQKVDTHRLNELRQSAEVLSDSPEFFSLGQGVTPEFVAAITNVNRIKNTLGKNPNKAYEVALESYTESKAGGRWKAYQTELETYNNKVGAVEKNNALKAAQYQEKIKQYNTALKAGRIAEKKTLETSIEYTAAREHLKAVTKDFKKAVSTASKAYKKPELVATVKQAKRRVDDATKKLEAISTPKPDKVLAKELGIKIPREPKYLELPVEPKMPKVKPPTKEKFVEAYKQVIPTNLVSLSPAEQDAIISAAADVTRTLSFISNDVSISADDVIKNIELANANEVFNSDVTLAKGDDILESVMPNTANRMMMSEFKVFKEEYTAAKKLAKDRAAAKVKQLKVDDAIRKEYDSIVSSQNAEIAKSKELASKKLVVDTDAIDPDNKKLKNLGNLVTAQQKAVDNYIANILDDADASLPVSGYSEVVDVSTKYNISDRAKAAFEVLGKESNTTNFTPKAQAIGMRNLINEVIKESNNFEETVEAATKYAAEFDKIYKAANKNTSIYNHTAKGYMTSIKTVSDTLGSSYTTVLNKLLKYGTSTDQHMYRLDAMAQIHHVLEDKAVSAIRTIDAKRIQDPASVEYAPLIKDMRRLAAFRATIPDAEDYFDSISKLSPKQSEPLMSYFLKIDEELANKTSVTLPINSYMSSSNKRVGMPSLDYDVDSTTIEEAVTANVVGDSMAETFNNLRRLDERKPFAKTFMEALGGVMLDLNYAKKVSSVHATTLANTGNAYGYLFYQPYKRLAVGAIRGNKEYLQEGADLISETWSYLFNINNIVKGAKYGFDKAVHNVSTFTGTRTEIDGNKGFDKLWQLGENQSNPIVGGMIKGLAGTARGSAIIAKFPLTFSDAYWGMMGRETIGMVRLKQSARKLGLTPNTSEYEEYIMSNTPRIWDDTDTLIGRPSEEFVEQVHLTAPLTDQGLAKMAASGIDAALKGLESKHPVMQVIRVNKAPFLKTMGNAVDQIAEHIPIYNLVGSETGWKATAQMLGGNFDTDELAQSAATGLLGLAAMAGAKVLWDQGYIQTAAGDTKDYFLKKVLDGGQVDTTSVSINGVNIPLEWGGGLGMLMAGMGSVFEKLDNHSPIYDDDILQADAGSKLARLVSDTWATGTLLLNAGFMQEFFESLGTNTADFIVDPAKGVIDLATNFDEKSARNAVNNVFANLIPTHILDTVGGANAFYKAYANQELNDSFQGKDAASKALNRIGAAGSKELVRNVDLYGNPIPQSSTVLPKQTKPWDAAQTAIYKLNSKYPNAIDTRIGSEIGGIPITDMRVNNINGANLYHQELRDAKIFGVSFKEELNRVVKSDYYNEASNPILDPDNIDRLKVIKPSANANNKAALIQYVIDRYHALAQFNFLAKYQDNLTVLDPQTKVEVPYFTKVQNRELIRELPDFNTSDQTDVLNSGFINTP